MQRSLGDKPPRPTSPPGTRQVAHSSSVILSAAPDHSVGSQSEAWSDGFGKQASLKEAPYKKDEGQNKLAKEGLTRNGALRQEKRLFPALPAC